MRSGVPAELGKTERFSSRRGGVEDHDESYDRFLESEVTSGALRGSWGVRDTGISIESLC